MTSPPSSFKSSNAGRFVAKLGAQKQKSRGSQTTLPTETIHTPNSPTCVSCRSCADSSGPAGLRRRSPLSPPPWAASCAPRWCRRRSRGSTPSRAMPCDRAGSSPCTRSCSGASAVSGTCGTGPWGIRCDDASDLIRRTPAPAVSCLPISEEDRDRGFNRRLVRVSWKRCCFDYSRFLLGIYRVECGAIKTDGLPSEMRTIISKNWDDGGTATDGK